MRKRWTLNRRALLRGALGSAGVAVGLPILEAMLNGHGTALADGTPLPKRFGVWFWGNGTEPGAWAPASQGPSWQPSEILQPLTPVKDYVNVVSGATLPTWWHLDDPRRQSPHTEGPVAILTGGNPLLHSSYSGQTDVWDYMTVPGPSVDQIAADHIQGVSLYRSLTIGITPVHTADAGSTNSPGTAQSYISHTAPYLFNPAMMDPSEVFAYVFGDGVSTGGTPPMSDPEDLLRASLLDAVLDDATALRGRLGGADRLRLDEHMEGIHALQKRLEGLPPTPPSDSCKLPVDPGNPDSFRDRAKAMADLVAMAFACDLTRVVSFQFSSPASHVDYPDIFPSGLVFNGSPISFHEYEHNAGIDDTVRTGLKYFMELYADFLLSLQAIPEPGGSLLDSCCILGTSDVSDGPSHGFTDYPLLVAGRAGGALQFPGTHVALAGDNAVRVPFTCLKAVDVPLSSWGSDQLFVDQPVSAILA